MGAKSRPPEDVRASFLTEHSGYPNPRSRKEQVNFCIHNEYSACFSLVMRRMFAPLVVVLSGAACPAASAAVIDLFRDGPQELTSPGNSGAWQSASPVALADSIFDSRAMRVQYGAQSLRVDTTIGNLLYEVLPDGAGGNDRGYFEIIYASSSPTNLLADGATSFEARFALLEFGSSFGPLQISVSSSAGNATVSGYFTSSSDTSLRFDFSRFSGVNFSAVTQIRFGGWRIPEGSTFVLGSLQTVPEPSIPLLSALSAAIVLGRRRRET
jgi:hypothetical protein